ncbi:MAG: hypothetical protein HUT38_02800 [Candidatus Paceibacter sp.]|nr:hypothetical protein [Candidatus Paceibacter sp.]
MKNTNDNYKKDVLIAALEERYEAMRIIRERVQNIGVWALGFMVAVAGWISQSDSFIALEWKFFYLIALGVAFWALRFRYLSDLKKGFSIQQRVVVRLEKALGLYTPKTFDDLEDPIYPKKWEQAGNAEGDGKFFSSTYLLLYIGFAILAFAMFLQSEHNSFICLF